MKSKLIITSICMMLIGVSYAVAHEGYDGDGKHSMTGTKTMMDNQMPKDAIKSVEVGNQFCPVSGDKIEMNGEMGNPGKFEYHGKIYNLCCPMCAKDFKKDPKKYSKIAEKEVKKSE